VILVGFTSKDTRGSMDGLIDEMRTLFFGEGKLQVKFRSMGLRYVIILKETNIIHVYLLLLRDLLSTDTRNWNGLLKVAVISRI